jgi:transposase
LPAHLKRERIMHDLAEAVKHCAACDQDPREFGEETSERYEYIPAQLIVIEGVCKKYACGVHGEDGEQALTADWSARRALVLFRRGLWRNTPITYRCTGREYLPAPRQI